MAGLSFILLFIQRFLKAFNMQLQSLCPSHQNEPFKIKAVAVLLKQQSSTNVEQNLI